MNISHPKKITTLKYFVDAYPESLESPRII